MFKKILILAFLGIGISYSCKAQSVVYYDVPTGQWGYSFSGGNILNNYKDAFGRCIDAGGRNPQKLLATTGKGFGAIAMGQGKDGTYKLGATAGAKTANDATNSAIEACRKQGAIRNIVIKANWNDN